MRNYHLRRNTHWCPTLNLDKLWTLVSEQTRLKYKDAKPDGKVPVIDLVKAVRTFFFLLIIIFCDGYDQEVQSNCICIEYLIKRTSSRIYRLGF